jgi:hypothetical protein
MYECMHVCMYVYTHTTHTHTRTFIFIYYLVRVDDLAACDKTVLTAGCPAAARHVWPSRTPTPSPALVACKHGQPADKTLPALGRDEK